MVKTKTKKKKKPRNKFELKVFKQLEDADKDFKYESEKIPYVIHGKYTPDFVIDTPSGGKIYVETKGYFRYEAMRKMAAVKKLHPDMDIRIVFYSKKKSDINWAIKNNFKYAVGEIPQEWLDGF